MECRKFDITVISANNLEDVRKICKMKVYARVLMGGRSEMEKRTPVDKHSELHISESMVQNYNTMLVVKLYCKRTLGDRYIGEIHTPMKELFDCARAGGGLSTGLTFPVQKGYVNSQGALRLSYRFGEKAMIDKKLLAESVAGWSLC
ncbi:hypothetical protein CDL12_14058 [Handroanthus impetiginosus]|uniref:C2 domain-containing protein n=1 Tax=Handroanthus impetiginosus TaxID=429701 RepID=A0A2G9H728_9LAMI|nr:hypothetical protein CDL12_14058 [Handroanthus impetiginosus]